LAGPARPARKKTVVIGLGNDLLGDDAVGVLVARSLQERLRGKADVIETAIHGIALLDLFIGYQHAVLVDAIQTGKYPPGKVLEIDPDDLRPVQAPSPHYAGLPEMLALARQYDLDFPKDFRIFAIEVADPYTIGGQMTPAVLAVIPEVCDRVCQAVAAIPWSE